MKGGREGGRYERETSGRRPTHSLGTHDLVNMEPSVWTRTSRTSDPLDLKRRNQMVSWEVPPFQTNVSNYLRHGVSK